MILVDTSVWVEVLRDRQGTKAASFRSRVGSEISVLCRFSQMELLLGAKNEREWKTLDEYLSSQYYLEVSEITWREAARIYFELRRKSITINSPIDCYIAQIAIESGSLLLHQDQDFERIAEIRPLLSERFKPHLKIWLVTKICG